MEKVDILLLDFDEVVTPKDRGKPAVGKEQGSLLVVKNGGIALKDGQIVEVADSAQLESKYSASKILRFPGKSAVPGFVDPHTHLVYAGCRHEEFELRLRGVPYVEILKSGGGINDTVRQTRAASEEELLKFALMRLKQAISHGTTSLEVKSGYGLDFENELKLLRVIRKLSESSDVTVVPTFLGAHAVPPEYRDNRAGYVELVVEKMLPEFRGLATFVDVFMDEGAFTAEETRKIFERAKELGYKLKLHADELAPTGGAELAAEYHAVSADHLVKISDEGIRKMAESGTIAVLLPATTFMLRHREYAPARRLIEAGVPVALATDHNPGTSPVISQAISMGLATMMMDMTPAEALTAATLNAAYAIGLGEKTGSLEPGKWADIVVLDAHSYIHIVYEFGKNTVKAVFKRGEMIYES